MSGPSSPEQSRAAGRGAHRSARVARDLGRRCWALRWEFAVVQVYMSVMVAIGTRSDIALWVWAAVPALSGAAAMACLAVVDWRADRRHRLRA
jgi:hypothetical protein